MSRVPLRYKMTLLYSAMTVLLCVALLAGLYSTMRSALMRAQEAQLAVSYEQLAALIEVEDGRFVVEDELKLPPNMDYQISTEEDGVSLERRMPPALMEEPFEPGPIKMVETISGHWLLLDGVVRVEEMDVRVRLCLSLESVDDTLRLIERISLVACPLLLLFSVLGGVWISRRSLRPIDRIIATTMAVADGNLNERIPETKSRDEVGQLTLMMNDMLEKLEKSFQREKRFVSDASHELRTPVSIIFAYAEALSQELGDESETAKSVLTILAESRRMQRIIHQLLTVTRGEEGRYLLENAPVDMSEVARTVAEQMEPLALAQSIAIRVNAPPSARVMGDQSLLTQMMINLVENAVKYGKKHGGVDIEVAVEHGDCRVAVADDGIGIPPESLPHIYERFYRADTARDRSGTGLGLAIVRWIVLAHHGKIEAGSESGKGTTVTVTLKAE